MLCVFRTSHVVQSVAAGTTKQLFDMLCAKLSRCHCSFRCRLWLNICFLRSGRSNCTTLCFSNAFVRRHFGIRCIPCACLLDVVEDVVFLVRFLVDGVQCNEYIEINCIHYIGQRLPRNTHGTQRLPQRLRAKRRKYNVFQNVYQHTQWKTLLFNCRG